MPPTILGIAVTKRNVIYAIAIAVAVIWLLFDQPDLGGPIRNLP